MAHPLDKWEPTDADVIHIQSKALDEKAQTIYRLEQENEDLRAVNADLLAACEAALEDGQDYKLSETIKRRLRAAIDKAKAD